MNVVAAAREHLVRIRLVPDVPHQLIARRVEDVVQRDRELDDTEPCADVAAGARTHIDEPRTDVRGKLPQLVARHRAQIRGRLYSV